MQTCSNLKEMLTCRACQGSFALSMGLQVLSAHLSSKCYLQRLSPLMTSSKPRTRMPGHFVHPGAFPVSCWWADAGCPKVLRPCEREEGGVTGRRLPE